MNPAHVSISTAAQLVLPGAICGDIIGSSYEFNPTKDLNFKLFDPDFNFSRYTDDTVCSIAIADALVTGKTFESSLLKWCRLYHHAGYGGNFRRWFRSATPTPYNSWGNGSAMRVSAVGAYSRSLNEVMCQASHSAEVSHNHPEGIKGAQATATAIYFALRGMDKNEIKSVIEKGFGYNLSRDYYEIRASYSFDVSCQGSVPESIIAFLVSTDYESAIRHAVALGGDADTMGAIAGGIAAAYYKEIPRHILEECLRRVPEDMREVIRNFNMRLNERYGE